jgi:hypothetical protein
MRKNILAKVFMGRVFCNFACSLVNWPRHSVRKLAPLASDFDTPQVFALFAKRASALCPRMGAKGMALLASLPPCFLFAVSRASQFVKYWLLVISCVALIFFWSGDTLSERHAARMLGPLIRWLFLVVTAGTVGRLIFLIRKCGHLTE